MIWRLGISIGALSLAFAACGSRSELDVPDGGTVDGDPIDGNPSITSKCKATTMVELFATDVDASIVDPFDQIALDDSYVYFHSGYGIRRVPKGGGAAETLATNVGATWPNLSYFTLDSSGVSFIGRHTDGMLRLFRVAKNGSPLVSGPPISFGNDFEISARAGGYYVWGGTNGTDDVIATIAANGNVTSPTAALIEGAYHVIDQGDSPAYILGGMVFLYEDPQLKIIAPILPLELWGVVDVGDALYATGVRNDAPTDEKVWRIDKATNQSTNVLAYPTGELGLAGITADTSFLYFCDRTAASVVRVSREGGATTVLGSSPRAQSIDVAVDDDCVYWTTVDEYPPSGPGLSHVYAAPK